MTLKEDLESQIQTLQKELDTFKEVNQTNTKILNDRLDKIQQLEQTIEKIREECDKIRCTGIPCVLSPETEKMHDDLNSKMELVKIIESIIDKEKKDG